MLLKRSLIGVVAFALALILIVTGEFPDRGRHFAQAKTDRAGTYDLAKARMMTKVIGHVRSHYVDPTRIDAKRMAVEALRAVQGHVAEVMVQVHESKEGVPSRVEITVDETSKTFSLERVGDLYELNWKLMDVFDFLERHLPPSLDLEELEYAAVNGVLSTLDPHSVLLSPRVYREMQVGTQGKFGGLGVVISVSEGQLTVMSVMPDTPAEKAGLESGDTVVQIGEESTVNMPLNDAVNRLRGEPGTEVTIWIKREEFTTPKAFPIVREEIRLRSVEHQDLGDGVGYVNIRNFQSNTFEDLQSGLEALARKAGGLKALVLDLRENPGGLLDQAIEISDRFISAGTLVTTVRDGSREREERHATSTNSLTDVPMVVLINRGSASASEIVAGALKNNNRAMVVGQTSFGKGSVQVVYKLDDAALKLTVAQYLTPGDVSIQSVGIVPDIEIQTVKVTDASLDLNPAGALEGREASLKSHLESHRTRSERPAVQLRLLAESKKQTKRYGEFKADQLIVLAKDLVQAAPATNRRQALVQAAGFLKHRQEQEDVRVAQRFEELGVDWTPGAKVSRPKLTAKVEVVGAERVRAGETVELMASVKNEGRRTVHRVHGELRSTIGAFDGKEFAFGRVEPGQTRQWKTTVKLPRSMDAHGDILALELYQGPERVPGETFARVTIDPLPRPLFAYSVQVADPKGNGDGLIQRGERVNVQVRVTNVGEGPADEVLATIKNESGEDVFIETGRAKIGSLGVGETRQVDFTLKVRKSLKTRDVQVGLAVVDQALRTWSNNTLTLPVFPGEFPAAKPAGGVAVVGESAVELRAGAHRNTAALAMAAPATQLSVVGRAGEWLKVRWTEGSDPREAWVLAEKVRLVSGGEVVPAGATASSVSSILQHHPPEIAVRQDISQYLITTRNRVSIAGVAKFKDTDASARRDIYIFRDEDKVYFRSAPSAAAAESAVTYDTTIPLKPGENEITIVAREGEDDVTQRRLTIYRK